MNVFLILLFIPLSFATVFESAPKCDEMGSILEGFEKDLQRDSIKGCKEGFHQELIKGFPDLLNKEFLKDKACLDLATIETELSQQKMELAVLNGINKLVETVKDSKAKAASKKPEEARKNAHTFVESLNTAQSLELLLSSVTDEGKPLLSELRKFPRANLLNESDLRDRVRELCKNRAKDANDACNDKIFKPAKVATEEVLGLVRNTEATNDDLKKWRDQLAIKRKTADEKKEAYTFNQMQSELSEAFAQIDSKEPMSKDHLRAITLLDDFEFDDKFNFVQDIKGLREQNKIKEASDKFFLLMGDAKRREQFQVLNKMSIVWEDVKDNVPLKDDEKNKCQNAKSNYSDAVLCANAIEANLSKVTNSLALPKLKAFIPALKTSMDYVDTLAAQEETCREEIKTKQEVSEACFAKFNRDRAKLQDQIIQLNIVKEKIGAQNVDLMKFRNYALQKWTDQKCHTASSAMDMCEDESVLQKDALLTVEDSMKIAVLFTKADTSDAEKIVEPLCRDRDRSKKTAQDRICAFFWQKIETDPPPKEKKNNDADGPMAAPNGNVADRNLRDAWIQGGTNILNSILPQIYQNQMNQIPPYPYNYSPYPMSTGPMGIADTIMFNSRYYGGYGYYMPTPGYVPYTAFGSGSPMAPYRAVTPSFTKYTSY